MGSVRVKWTGEACLFVEFGNIIDIITINVRVQTFKAMLQK